MMQDMMNNMMGGGMWGMGLIGILSRSCSSSAWRR